MSLNYEHELVEKAKQLRKSMTEQERKLWFCFLKKYPIRFQRQKTIGFYIADFYCHKAKLIIELDGSQHYKNNGLEHDKNRTAELEKNGIKVLRYTNREIDTKFEAVCNQIDHITRDRVT